MTLFTDKIGAASRLGTRDPLRGVHTLGESMMRHDCFAYVLCADTGDLWQRR